MRRYYPAFLHHSAEDTNYGVTFPNFMGCVTCGKTQQEAVELAHEALQLHIKGMIEDGDFLPAPYSLDAIPADPEMQDDVVAVVLVGVIVPSPPKRVNISIDEGLLEQIDAAANGYGMTRSTLLAEASRQYLQGVSPQ